MRRLMVAMVPTVTGFATKTRSLTQSGVSQRAEPARRERLSGSSSVIRDFRYEAGSLLARSRPTSEAQKR